MIDPSHCIILGAMKARSSPLPKEGSDFNPFPGFSINPERVQVDGWHRSYPSGKMIWMVLLIFITVLYLFQIANMAILTIFHSAGLGNDRF